MPPGKDNRSSSYHYKTLLCLFAFWLSLDVTKNILHEHRCVCLRIYLMYLLFCCNVQSRQRHHSLIPHETFCCMFHYRSDHQRAVFAYGCGSVFKQIVYGLYLPPIFPFLICCSLFCVYFVFHTAYMLTTCVIVSTVDLMGLKPCP